MSPLSLEDSMRRAYLSIAVLVSACVPQQPVMRPAAVACKSCSEDAIVVFVLDTPQPDVVDVREQDGTFLGRLENRTWFAAAVAPGHHLFISEVPARRQDSTPGGLMADLAPGKVYYVEVMLPAYQPVMFAAGPARRHWDDLMAKKGRLGRVERDPTAPEPPTPERWPMMVGRVKGTWAGLPQSQWEARTLLATDGVAADAALVESAAAGVACAPKPADLFAAMGNPSANQDEPICWKERPVGSHVTVIRCATPRQLDQQYEDTQHALMLNNLRRPLSGN
jgi:hypothetical protein